MTLAVFDHVSVDRRKGLCLKAKYEVLHNLHNDIEEISQRYVTLVP